MHIIRPQILHERGAIRASLLILQDVIGQDSPILAVLGRTIDTCGMSSWRGSIAPGHNAVDFRELLGDPPPALGKGKQELCLVLDAMDEARFIQGLVISLGRGGTEREWSVAVPRPLYSFGVLMCSSSKSRSTMY